MVRPGGFSIYDSDNLSDTCIVEKMLKEEGKKNPRPLERGMKLLLKGKSCNPDITHTKSFR